VAADRFGTAVAISGTTVVVGAYDHAKDAGGPTCSPRPRPVGSR